MFYIFSIICFVFSIYFYFDSFYNISHIHYDEHGYLYYDFSISCVHFGIFGVFFMACPTIKNYIITQK